MSAINRVRTSLTGSTGGLGARQLYGTGRSLPQVVSALYEKLDKLRQLAGSEAIEDILDELIAWRTRLNRFAELQNKVRLSESDYEEMRAIQQMRKATHELRMQSAMRRLEP
jgi:hypothetical protein